jgi:hypothetical protein
MSRGDRVVIVVDTGGGSKTVEIGATKAGRKVEVVGPGRGVLEVNEVTRNGEVVRSAKFMATRVISVVEYPVGD